MFIIQCCLIICIGLLSIIVLPDDGDVGEPVRAGDLDAAADENTYAATQYKAMKLQQEPAKPKMVCFSIVNRN